VPEHGRATGEIDPTTCDEQTMMMMMKAYALFKKICKKFFTTEILDLVKVFF
jgi:hypothetical protein